MRPKEVRVGMRVRLARQIPELWFADGPPHIGDQGTVTDVGEDGSVGVEFDEWGWERVMADEVEPAEAQA